MRALAILFAASLVACGGGGGPEAVPGTQVKMSFAGGFYEAPFPSEHRRIGGGTRIDLTGFPNPTRVELAEKLRALLASDADGFGTTSGIFFPLTGPLSEGRLPGAPSTAGDAVLLIGIDPASPDYLVRYPITARFMADAGPFGTKNLLVLLPLQGVPLRPHTEYAAAVLRSAVDARGQRLGVSESLAELAAGRRPSGLAEAPFAAYTRAIAAFARAGHPKEELAGVAAFRTQDPEAGLRALRAAILMRPVPELEAPLQLHEVFDDYCVFEGATAMPDYQAGEPPFSTAGGEIRFDGDQRPIVARSERARVVVTIPRQTMPATGFPAVVFIRTGGGGDRPLVDRGVQPASGAPALVAGSGPARTFARAGIAGVSVDGPHGGLRNITRGDEQFLIFNIQNPIAMRDNLRQSALELMLLPRMLDRLEVDASACAGVAPGVPRARIDTTKLMLMGHSMGATIAPLVLAEAPEYGAAILSGAGGSWIENVIFKRKPVAVKEFAEILLGYRDLGLELTEFDPLLSLLQWAGEPADPPVYARHIASEPEGRAPANVLMLQGIVDHYILPEIANATSLSIGLDLAGAPLEGSLEPLLPLVGRGRIALPAAGNRERAGARFTAIVVQHPEDGIEDGHEVVFQTEAPKHQIRCFLESYVRSGIGAVAPPAPEDAACEAR